MDAVSRSLLEAQKKAEALFTEIVRSEMICAGKLESELTAEIHALAESRFGVRRHWHKRIARAGPNSMLCYYDETEDRRIVEDDIVYLDLGPVFESWEADFGRTYALGSDPHKHRLIKDIAEGFQLGKEFYRSKPDVTCGELYDFVSDLAVARGWEFGNATAGHLIGRFPHEQARQAERPLSIRHGNDLPLREPDDRGLPRHWILEIHFIDRTRQIGGFFEELLTVDTSDKA